MKQTGKSACAGLLIVLLVTFTLLSGNIILHQALHNDAAQSSHQCAITLFQQQLIISAEVLVAVLVLSTGFVFLQPPVLVRVFSKSDHSISDSRAPPKFTVSHR